MVVQSPGSSTGGFILTGVRHVRDELERLGDDIASYRLFEHVFQSVGGHIAVEHDGDLIAAPPEDRESGHVEIERLLEARLDVIWTTSSMPEVSLPEPWSRHPGAYARASVVVPPRTRVRSI